MNNPPRLIDIAGITVELRRGGSGTPVLVIHGELGVPGWLESFAQLAEHHDVIVPSLPGYGRSTRPDWIMGVHDLAAWVTWFARDIDLRTPVNVIGCSLGGWVAAEIATVAPQFFNKMVLVGAMGIKPEQGEIFDYFLESGLTGLRRAFHRPEQSSAFMRYWGNEWTPEETDLVEQHREMTCRIAWKPYMHSLTLRHLLPGVSTPTLLLWGGEDAITPINSGEIYQRAIPRSRLVVIENCGHMPEMEKPTEFAGLIENFLAG
ncbi:MAG TPA: alpha/beta hydrolase [Stellaceae bacterium]|jgi:pimeloyl-ACP methyl ester carboxylesterase|nr:alpha/beta hydrolase [Stellaceae bacterium]